jgi:hypothetical protein
MPKSNTISLNQLVSSLGPRILLKTARSALITSATGITFERVQLGNEPGKPSHEPGKVLIVSHPSKEIDVNIDPKKPVTKLTTKVKAGPDQKMLLRIPNGVLFFEICPLPAGLPADMERIFFFQTSDGYTAVPFHLKRGEDTDQTVQELILVTTHVPPRLDPNGVTGNKVIPKLTMQEIQVLLKPD